MFFSASSLRSSFYVVHSAVRSSDVIIFVSYCCGDCHYQLHIYTHHRHHQRHHQHASTRMYIYYCMRPLIINTMTHCTGLLSNGNVSYSFNELRICVCVHRMYMWWCSHLSASTQSFNSYSQTAWDFESERCIATVRWFILVVRHIQWNKK